MFGGGLRFRAGCHVLAAEGLPPGAGGSAPGGGLRVVAARGRKAWATPEVEVGAGGAVVWDHALEWELTVARGGAGGRRLSPKEYSLKVQRREGSRFLTVCKGHLDFSAFLSLDPTGALPTEVTVRLSPGEGRLSLVVGGEWLREATRATPGREELSPLPSPKDWAATWAPEARGPQAVVAPPSDAHREGGDLAGLVEESLNILASSSDEESDGGLGGSLWGKVRRTFTPARTPRRANLVVQVATTTDGLPGASVSKGVDQERVRPPGAQASASVAPETSAPAKELDFAAAGLEAAGEPAEEPRGRGGPTAAPLAGAEAPRELDREVARLEDELRRSKAESQTRGARLRMLEADLARTQNGPGRVELLDELISSKLKVASLEGEMVDLRGQLWQLQQENRRLEARLGDAEEEVRRVGVRDAGETQNSDQSGEGN